MRFHKLSAFCAVFAVLIGLLAGCAAPSTQKNDKFRVICTVFPAYDFVRQIAGDAADVTLLLPPGQECHSYEPTPKDILAIQNCDLFVWVGGESEVWVEDLVTTVGKNNLQTIRLMDCVELLEEGHDHKDGHHHEKAYDEHVWTAPLNAVKMVGTLGSALSSLIPTHAGAIATASADYQAKLKALDADIRATTTAANTRTLVFGDRFPFRYFAESYGLTCHAPYESCAHDAEPSAAAIASLIDTVKAENLPVVMYIEFSNQKIADTLCESTGAEKRLFHSCHNLTAEELNRGETYLSLMRKNLDVLKEALT